MRIIHGELRPASGFLFRHGLHGGKRYADRSTLGFRGGRPLAPRPAAVRPSGGVTSDNGPSVAWERRVVHPAGLTVELGRLVRNGQHHGCR